MSKTTVPGRPIKILLPENLPRDKQILKRLRCTARFAQTDVIVVTGAKVACRPSSAANSEDQQNSEFI
jgi:hypothetical protein